MGGTFMATTYAFQEDFVKRCLDAFNGKESESLAAAQMENEKTKNRCIGLTIETRADYCSQRQIDHMLKMGCTRVEIGVQATDNDLLEKTKRGHGTQANVEAIKLLKQNGLKVCVHWMPGLTGLYGRIDEAKEIAMFKKLFTPDYSPDELKIYPTLVIQGTELHELWKQGKYTPLTEKQMIRLLIEFKKLVPGHIRIKRVMRDISEHKPEAGAKTTNLRQLAKIAGAECRCIRCREVEHTNVQPKEISLKRADYSASNGQEIFLSCEGEGSLIGFLRLRLDNPQTARIRELHVYGSMVPIDEENDTQSASYGSGGWQHTGIGKKLMAEAERIAKEHGKASITVTSGIGAREYYRKLGYSFESPYMAKNLVN
jgi:elongator complex protein 3